MAALNDLIRQVASESNAIDPRKLAEDVASAAPSRQLRELLAEAVVDDCNSYLLATRNRAVGARPIRRTNTSARLARQRDWWAEFLSASVHIGNGARKALGDCTLSDLQQMINERIACIAGIQTFIDQYETLAGLMRKHKTTHVRDLPREAVESGLAA